MEMAEIQFWSFSTLAAADAGVMLGYAIGLLLGISKGKDRVLHRVRRLMVEGGIPDEAGARILRE